jgi:hypothetical protein
MEEQTENFEIPSRRRRFSAYLLDLIINFSLIWLIINLIIIATKKSCLWNIIVWIKAIDNNNNPLNLWKALLRFWIFYSTISILLFFIFQLLSVRFCLPFWYWTTFSCLMDNDSQTEIIAIITFILWKIIFIPYIINLIEIFFKCPTFIDKRLWIKRIYNKSK